jgi:hypothetical protein
MSAALHLKKSPTRTRQARKTPCRQTTRPFRASKGEQTAHNLLLILRKHVVWNGQILRPHWRRPFGLSHFQQHLLLLLYVTPGLSDRQLALRMWGTTNTGAAVAQMRRLKQAGFVLIRYEPMICYYLSAKGFDVINILTGDER